MCVCLCICFAYAHFHGNLLADAFCLNLRLAHTHWHTHSHTYTMQCHMPICVWMSQFKCIALASHYKCLIVAACTGSGTFWPLGKHKCDWRRMSSWWSAARSDRILHHTYTKPIHCLIIIPKRYRTPAGAAEMHKRKLKLIDTNLNASIRAPNTRTQQLTYYHINVSTHSCARGEVERRRRQRRHLMRTPNSAVGCRSSRSRSSRSNRGSALGLTISAPHKHTRLALRDWWWASRVCSMLAGLGEDVHARAAMHLLSKIRNVKQ